MGQRAGADGGLSEEGLLAEAVGDFGELKLIRTDGGKVVGLADEVEGAESFPDLFVGGGNGSDFGADGDGCSRSDEDGADAAADRCAEFDGSSGVLRGGRGFDLQLGDQAALMDGGAWPIGVRDAARGGSDDYGRLKESDDLGAAGSITEANERERGVAADQRRRILQHL
jgi:hypothetical protein